MAIERSSQQLLLLFLFSSCCAGKKNNHSSPGEDNKHQCDFLTSFHAAQSNCFGTRDQNQELPDPSSREQPLQGADPAAVKTDTAQRGGLHRAPAQKYPRALGWGHSPATGVSLSPFLFFFWCKSFTSSSHLPSFYPHKGISHSLAYLSHHLFIQHETVCATPFLPPKFLF